MIFQWQRNKDHKRVMNVIKSMNRLEKEISIRHFIESCNTSFNYGMMDKDVFKYKGSCNLDIMLLHKIRQQYIQAGDMRKAGTTLLIIITVRGLHGSTKDYLNTTEVWSTLIKGHENLIDKLPEGIDQFIKE